jgi:hypothetical protein
MTNRKPEDSRAAKRARFSSTEQQPTPKNARRRGTLPLGLIAGLVMVVVLAGAVVFALGRGTAASDLSPATQIDNAAAEVQSGSAQSVAAQVDSAPAQPAAASANVKAATFGHDPYPVVAAQDGAVRLPLSTFDDYKAHFYTYLVDGQSIEFFVVKSQDGIVRAALNACDVCFSARLGYLQRGDEMECQNCGSRFPTDKINVLRGGCNPSPLERTIVGDMLVILDSDLAQGLQYF